MNRQIKEAGGYAALASLTCLTDEDVSIRLLLGCNEQELAEGAQ